MSKKKAKTERKKIYKLKFCYSPAKRNLSLTNRNKLKISFWINWFDRRSFDREKKQQKRREKGMSERTKTEYEVYGWEFLYLIIPNHSLCNVVIDYA